MAEIDLKQKTEAHIKSVSNLSPALTKITGGFDPNENNRSNLLHELVNTLYTLNQRVANLEAELASLKEGSQ